MPEKYSLNIKTDMVSLNFSKALLNWERKIKQKPSEEKNWEIREMFNCFQFWFVGIMYRDKITFSEFSSVCAVTFRRPRVVLPFDHWRTLSFTGYNKLFFLKKGKIQMARAQVSSLRPLSWWNGKTKIWVSPYFPADKFTQASLKKGKKKEKNIWVE